MRHSKQVTLTIVLTVVLVGLAWYAGRSRDKIQTTPVVVVLREIEAGSQLDSSDLGIVEVPAKLVRADWVTDAQMAIGLICTTDLSEGEILLGNRITGQSAGLLYPGTEPGRRLMTIRLDAAAANGYWLAEGSLVDIYLVPSSPTDQEIQMLAGVRILKIMGQAESTGFSYESQGSDLLICLDLSPEEAILLAAAETWYSLKIAAVSDSCAPLP
ncbi:MAG: Flp pilus assembly protein CpaB [Bacillota bacterium]|nr:Flp pilus assembly protein CpaB [Bacillota bacterium]